MNITQHELSERPFIRILQHHKQIPGFDGAEMVSASWSTDWDLTEVSAQSAYIVPLKSMLQLKEW